MDSRLEHYLLEGYTYSFLQGPDRVRSREDALRYGLNCVALAHLAIKDLFDYELSPELKCVELYQDRKHFMPVSTLEEVQTGDLAWFGLEHPALQEQDFSPHYENGQLVNWTDFPVKHVAVSTGPTEEGRLFLHATHVTGSNAVWPISKFADYRNYRKLYGITRLKAAS